MNSLLTKNKKKVVGSNQPTTLTKKKVLTSFRPTVFTRHPSHSPLRSRLPLLPFKAVIRLGSTTPCLPGRVECNSIEAIKNSASKLLMKRCFNQAGVRTADWLEGRNTNANQISEQLGFPVIAKSLYGSRGEGNSKLDSRQALESWLKGKTLSNYIFERFYTYTREYRLHVTNDGCFYTCRKLLRDGTPEKDKWHRHDSNSVWIVEENPSFNKPTNWDKIVADCIRAKNALGLDICAFDVKVQSAEDSKKRRRDNPEWIIIESCSAPSFGDVTTQKYLVEIPRVLRRKYEQR